MPIEIKIGVINKETSLGRKYFVNGTHLVVRSRERVGFACISLLKINGKETGTNKQGNTFIPFSMHPIINSPSGTVVVPYIGNNDEEGKRPST